MKKKAGETSEKDGMYDMDEPQHVEEPLTTAGATGWNQSGRSYQR